MGKDRKVVIIWVSFFVLMVGLLSVLAALKQKDALKEKKPAWKVYDKRVDYVTKDGFLIKDESKRGGITILPPGYEEKEKMYEISSFNIFNNTEIAHTVFASLPEFTRVKYLPNSVDGSKLWATAFREGKCLDSVLDNIQSDCVFELYEYDLNLQNLVKKKDLRFWVGVPVRNVYLLAHDPLQNVVWIGVDYEIPQNHLSSWTSDIESIDISNNYFATDLIRYDANTNKSLGISKTSYWMSNRFAQTHKSLVDTGANGELYFIGECDDLKCGDRTYRYDGVVVQKDNRSSQLPVFYYGQDLGFARNFQVTTDDENNYVYVVTKSFDQQKESHFFQYNIDNGRSFHIGKQPTQQDDDMRGIDVVDGRLAVGSFNGLAIYNPTIDVWKVLTDKDGLKSNNVEGVYEIEGGGVCITHEDDGASCLLDSLSEYLSDQN